MHQQKVMIVPDFMKKLCTREQVEQKHQELIGTDSTHLYIFWVIFDTTNVSIKCMGFLMGSITRCGKLKHLISALEKHSESESDSVMHLASLRGGHQ